MEIKKLFSAIFQVSHEQGINVYVVGGFVRDRLMGRPFKKDIDFVVEGSGLAFARALDIYLNEVGSLVEFPDFDTARYVFCHEHEDGSKDVLLEIEFAGARSEKYDTTSRKPQVTKTDLDEDLKRRDFCVNAIAQKVIKNGLSSKIIDPFDGQGDIKHKRLKTPCDPDITFSDDPLRMLRAARFAAQLDFSLDIETYDAMKRNKDRIAIVSAERIQEELFKLLATDEPSIGLWILYQSGLMNNILPEVCDLAGVEDMYGAAHKDNLSHTFKVVDNIATRTDNVLLRYAGLMHDIGKPGTKQYIQGRGWAFDMHDHLGKKIVRIIGKRLRMSKHDIEYVAHLVRWHQHPIALMDEGITDSAVRRLVMNLKDDLNDLLKLCRSDITTGNPQKLKRRLKNYDMLETRIAEVIEKDKLRAFQSPFRGEDIMSACHLKPGPTVGNIKKALEDAILEGIIPNEYEATKEYFEKIKDEYVEKAEGWEKMIDE